MLQVLQVLLDLQTHTVQPIMVYFKRPKVAEINMWQWQGLNRHQEAIFCHLLYLTLTPFMAQVVLFNHLLYH
nr:MAG TPA: hypothetical protein [Caudoviricetes sp.]